LPKDGWQPQGNQPTDHNRFWIQKDRRRAVFLVVSLKARNKMGSMARVERLRMLIGRVLYEMARRVDEILRTPSGKILRKLPRAPRSVVTQTT
jgi:hypothetical protein